MRNQSRSSYFHSIAAACFIGVLAALAMAASNPAPAATPASNPASAASSPVPGDSSPATQPSSPQQGRLGTCTHFDWGWDYRRIMPLIADAGLTWVRNDLMWDTVETQRGVYQIPAKDAEWIHAAHAYGLKLILILNGQNRLYQDHYDPEAFSRWAAWTVKELAGEVDAVEILNEPENFGFMKYYGGQLNGGEDSPWINRYVNLLNTAASAIKSANPQVKVVGLGSVPPANFHMISLGISPAVDGVADHPYSFYRVPELLKYAATPWALQRDGIATADERGTFHSQVEMYRRQCARFGGPREIWLTEFGYPTSLAPVWGGCQGVTPNAQAKYLLRRIVESLAMDVAVAIQYDIRDDGRDPLNKEHNFGLLDADLKPKPAYFAVQRTARAMAGCEPRNFAAVTVFTDTDRPAFSVDGEMTAPGTIWHYQFVNSTGQRMLAVWSAERAGGDSPPRRVDLEISPDLPVSKIRQNDLMDGTGQNIPFERHGSRLVLSNLTVPDYPIILTLEEQ